VVWRGRSFDFAQDRLYPQEIYFDFSGRRQKFQKQISTGPELSEPYRCSRVIGFIKSTSQIGFETGPHKKEIP